MMYMKITKYEHACVVMEEANEKLVIDPGELTVLPVLENVRAVVITHVHGDHLSIENIQALRKENSDMVVYAAAEAAEKLEAAGVEARPVTDQMYETVGHFRLLLQPTDHAVVYQTSPCKNVTVTVNDAVYHPGDSFDLPKEQVNLCLVPLAAPWAKAMETMEFIRGCNAVRFVPVHDGILSDAGTGFYNNWAGSAAAEKGAEYTVLLTGESVEV